MFIKIFWKSSTYAIAEMSDISDVQFWLKYALEGFNDILIATDNNNIVALVLLDLIISIPLQLHTVSTVYMWGPTGKYNGSEILYMLPIGFIFRRFGI